MKKYSSIYLKEKDFEVISSLEKKVGKIEFRKYDLPIKYADKHGFYAEEGEIEILIIGNKKIDNFPIEIFQLPQLKVLSVSASGFNSVPDEISELKDLKTLKLSNNGLEKFPKAICEIYSLEYVNLELNRFKEVPECIGKLINLKHLYLGQNNQLKKLPDTLWNLKNLEVLDLDTSPIERIPDMIENLHKLVMLDLVGTKVNELPLTIMNLKNLTKLSINYNPPYYSKEELKLLDDLERRGVEIWKE